MTTGPGGRARMMAGRHEGWYLKCAQGDIAERVILVGDPARVDVYAGMLESPRTVNKNRALVSVTGAHRGNRISVVSFGMCGLADPCRGAGGDLVARLSA